MANAVMLDDRACNRKSLWLTFGMIMGVAFFNAMAFFADKKLRKMAMRPITVIMIMVVNMIMIAGNKGI